MQELGMHLSSPDRNPPADILHSIAYVQSSKNHAESHGCFQTVKQETRFVSNTSKGCLFSVFFLLASVGVHILLANTGAPLTQPPDDFSGFGSYPSHAIPGSTLEWKRNTCGSSLNLWFNARWVNQHQCLSRHYNKQSSEKTKECAGIGWWGEHRRILSLAGGNATSTALTSRWEWGLLPLLLPWRCLSPLPHTDYSLKYDKFPHSKLELWKMKYAETKKSNWRMMLFKAVCFPKDSHPYTLVCACTVLTWPLYSVLSLKGKLNIFWQIIFILKL